MNDGDTERQAWADWALAGDGLEWLRIKLALRDIEKERREYVDRCIDKITEELDSL